MNLKKILAGVLACCAVGVIMPSVKQSVDEPATVANAVSYEHIEYEVVDYDYVKITGFDNTVDTVVIPAKIEGVPVTTIGKGAFKEASRLQSITIPNGVTTIEDEGFYNCAILTNVSLSSTLTKIGDSAFYKCISLEEIEIPDKVTTIGTRAFANCAALKSLTFPSSLNGKISDFVASNCTALKTVIINNGPTGIGKESFSGCSALRKVYIPFSITSTDSNVFYQCTWDKIVIYYAGNSNQWGTIWGLQFNNTQIIYNSSIEDVIGGNDNNDNNDNNEEIDYNAKFDVNGDGTADAVDASLILAYYGYASTGKGDQFGEYMAGLNKTN